MTAPTTAPREGSEVPSNGHGTSPAEVLKDAVREARRTPQPLELLTHNAPPRRPDWLVHGLLRRGTVNLFAGDTGLLKSWIVADLIRAVVTGTDWLGRDVRASRVLYLDEEMAADLVQDRLRALGVTVQHADRLRYYAQQGLSVGDTGSDRPWLEAELEDFRPDLVVIDSVMAATDTDVNDNRAVVQFMRSLKPLASKHSATFLGIHHYRKQQAGNVRTHGQGIMGGRQFVGQADSVLVVERERDDTQVEPHPDHDDRLIVTKKVRLENAKERSGPQRPPELIALTTEMDEDQTLYRASVLSLGVAPQRKYASEQYIDQVEETLRSHPEGLTTAAIAQALALTAQDSTFKRALADGVRAGRLNSPKRGMYRLPSDPDPVLDEIELGV